MAEDFDYVSSGEMDSETINTIFGLYDDLDEQINSDEKYAKLLQEEEDTLNSQRVQQSDQLHQLQYYAEEYSTFPKTHLDGKKPNKAVLKQCAHILEEIRAESFRLQSAEEIDMERINELFAKRSAYEQLALNGNAYDTDVSVGLDNLFDAIDKGDDEIYEQVKKEFEIKEERELLEKQRAEFRMALEEDKRREELKKTKSLQDMSQKYEKRTLSDVDMTENGECCDTEALLPEPKLSTSELRKMRLKHFCKK